MITLTHEEAQQPEALRLADWHKAMADEPKRNEAKRDKHRRTEIELRRLHEMNAELLEVSKVVCRFLDRGHDVLVGGSTHSKLRDAIAKATEEKQ